MYEDGTNVLTGTEFRTHSSRTTDWYLPSESRASANWEERWNKLKARFETIVDECRPVETNLIQTRIPAFARDSIVPPAIPPGLTLLQSGGSLWLEPAYLFGTDEKPLIGAFAVKGAHGKPLLNDDGTPRALRFGLFRQHSLFRELREETDTKLRELARDATALLYTLPEAVALSIWRNWLSGFSRGQNATDATAVDVSVQIIATFITSIIARSPIVGGLAACRT